MLSDINQANGLVQASVASTTERDNYMANQWLMVTRRRRPMLVMVQTLRINP
jgi:hypothetical protein